MNNPLNPKFYIVKLRFIRVKLVFLFLIQNIDCGYSLEPPRQSGSNVYLQSMFSAKPSLYNWKYQRPTNEVMQSITAAEWVTSLVLNGITGKSTLPSTKFSSQLSFA